MKIFWYVSPMVEWSFLLVSYGLFMIVTWCWVYQVQVSMASGKMALTKKSAPCPETILVVTTTKLEFSLHVACIVDRKFRVNDVGKLPCSCRGWTAERLWNMGLQPDKVSGGRLLEEDDGISIGACRRMVCRRIATSVWNHCESS